MDLKIIKTTKTASESHTIGNNDMVLMEIDTNVLMELLKTVQGYNGSTTQTLKHNASGVLQWTNG